MRQALTFKLNYEAIMQKDVQQLMEQDESKVEDSLDLDTLNPKSETQVVLQNLTPKPEGVDFEPSGKEVEI